MVDGPRNSGVPTRLSRCSLTTPASVCERALAWRRRTKILPRPIYTARDSGDPYARSSAWWYNASATSSSSRANAPSASAINCANRSIITHVSWAVHLPHRTPLHAEWDRAPFLRIATFHRRPTSSVAPYPSCPITSWASVSSGDVRPQDVLDCPGFLLVGGRHRRQPTGDRLSRRPASEERARCFVPLGRRITRVTNSMLRA